jgi:hypothetical protein
MAADKMCVPTRSNGVWSLGFCSNSDSRCNCAKGRLMNALGLCRAGEVSDRNVFLRRTTMLSGNNVAEISRVVRYSQRENSSFRNALAHNPHITRYKNSPIVSSDPILTAFEMSNMLSADTLSFFQLDCDRPGSSACHGDQTMAERPRVSLRQPLDGMGWNGMEWIAH